LNNTGSYEIELVNLSPRQWQKFLKEHSNLPGAKVNVELAKAFANIGTLMDFKPLVRLGPEEAPENTPEEFLTFCGVLGLGQYLAEYHDGGLLNLLRERANDPRERIRKAVVMAMKHIGHKDIRRLIKYTKTWIEGSYLEQDTVITAMCDQEMLEDRQAAISFLELLDWGMATLIQNEDEQFETGYQKLQEKLSCCWSVGIVALPEKGKPALERWISEHHPIINEILVMNLKREPLVKAEEEWVQECLAGISE
jgi:hypothetical protein